MACTCQEVKRLQKALASAAVALAEPADSDDNCTAAPAAAVVGSGGDAEADGEPIWEVGWSNILECVQEGGDVIYIPSGWNHAVLNTQVRARQTCYLLLAACCLLLNA